MDGFARFVLQRCVEADHPILLETVDGQSDGSTIPRHPRTGHVQGAVVDLRTAIVRSGAIPPLFDRPLLGISRQSTVDRSCESDGESIGFGADVVILERGGAGRDQTLKSGPGSTPALP